MRRSGRTTRQIQEAPHGAVFVWVNAQTWYPEGIAARLGRRDLKFVSPQWLETDKWRGVRLSGIVVDHEAADRLTGRQFDLLRNAQASVR